MALTANQLKSLKNLHGLPLGKILCIAKAAIKAYECVKAAGKDPAKIAQCVATFVQDIENCVKKG